MTKLSTDTMIRADQSGLGTASDGETYTLNGTFTASIASNEAVVTGSTGFTSAILGSQTTANINFLVRVEQTNNNFDGVGPCFRSSSNGQNCYFVAIYSGNLLFAKLVSNGFTQLASTNVSEVDATFYWIRVSMTGNHLQARVWQDGTGEPGTWNIDTTDSTYTTAGRYGMSFNAFSGSGVKFDHITVTDNSSITTNTRTITPVSAALKTTSTRTVTDSAALKTTNSRTVSDTVALKTTNQRAVDATAALKTVNTRTVSASAALEQTSKRTVPTSAALKTALTRSVPDSAALKTTSTRSVGSQAALLTTSIRTVPTSATLAKTRTVPCSACLSSTFIFEPNAMLLVPSGQTTLLVPSGETNLIVPSGQTTLII